MKPTSKLPTGVRVYDAAAERLCNGVSFHSCCAIAYAQARSYNLECQSSELLLFRLVYGYSFWVALEADQDCAVLLPDQLLNLRLIQLAFVRELWRQGYRAEDFT